MNSTGKKKKGGLMLVLPESAHLYEAMVLAFTEGSGKVANKSNDVIKSS
jgi:hypothetical protein